MNKMRSKRRAFLRVGFLSGVCFSWVSLFLSLFVWRPAQAQDVTFEGIRALIAEAESQRAELLSPGFYQSGIKSFQQAQADSQAEKSDERIQKSLLESQGDLQKAIKTAKLMSFSFHDLIAAYDSAAASNAQELAAENYRKGTKVFQEVVGDLEKGDLARARKNSGEAESLLRQAELEAIQASILGESRKLLEAAQAADGPKLSPVSYSAAQKALQRAEEFVREHRYEKSEAEQMADSTAYLLQHVLYVSQWIASLKKSPENYEKLILQIENYIREISNILYLKPRFDQDFILAVEGIKAAIRSLQDDRQRLQTQLADRDHRIGELEAEIEKLRSEKGKYVAELEIKRQEVDKQKLFEEKIERVSALFTPEEGAVLRSSSTGSDQIIIRLPGLRFASGSFDIRPENFSLLTKVLQAIREFPDWHIDVQGHTDSQGDEAHNLELSLKRAQAVKEYILQNLNIPESRITAEGFGEGQPIALNDNAQGRAKNRRIEIVLKR